MKNIILSLIMVQFMYFNNCNAQPTSPLPTPFYVYDVYTPKGQQVNDVTSISSEMNSDWVDYWDN